LNLTHNLWLLFVLAIVSLLLPLCDVKPKGDEPALFDREENDDSVLN
jgi:hypothetical protein